MGTARSAARRARARPSAARRRSHGVSRLRAASSAEQQSRCRRARRVPVGGLRSGRVARRPRRVRAAAIAPDRLGRPDQRRPTKAHPYWRLAAHVDADAANDALKRLQRRLGSDSRCARRRTCSARWGQLRARTASAPGQAGVGGSLRRLSDSDMLAARNRSRTATRSGQPATRRATATKPAGARSMRSRRRSRRSRRPCTCQR